MEPNTKNGMPIKNNTLMLNPRPTVLSIAALQPGQASAIAGTIAIMPSSVKATYLLEMRRSNGAME